MMTVFDRLEREAGAVRLDAASLDAFTAKGDCIVFFPGDPVKKRESGDVAVVLIEVLKDLETKPAIGWVPAAAETPEMTARLGVLVRPTLVFLRDGEILGSIPRLRSWAEYAETIPAILAGPSAAAAE